MTAVKKYIGGLVPVRRGAEHEDMIYTGGFRLVKTIALRNRDLLPILK